MINKLGYELIASQPNEDGYCLFKLVNTQTREVVAEIDRPCTLEDAFVMARKFLEELEEGE